MTLRYFVCWWLYYILCAIILFSLPGFDEVKDNFSPFIFVVYVLAGMGLCWVIDKLAGFSVRR